MKHFYKELTIVLNNISQFSPEEVTKIPPAVVDEMKNSTIYEPSQFLEEVGQSLSTAFTNGEITEEFHLSTVQDTNELYKLFRTILPLTKDNTLECVSKLLAIILSAYCITRNENTYLNILAFSIFIFIIECFKLKVSALFDHMIGMKELLHVTLSLIFSFYSEPLQKVVIV